MYKRQGLWIAAEQLEEYKHTLLELDEEEGMHIIRRMLYYRGPQTAAQVQARYLPDQDLSLIHIWCLFHI